MKAYESSFQSRMTTPALQSRQLLRAACAAAVLTLTALAFLGPGHALVQDAAAEIVQAAVTPAGLAGDIAWMTYLIAYALLLLAAVSLWIAAIVLTVWPPSSRARSS